MNVQRLLQPRVLVAIFVSFFMAGLLSSGVDNAEAGVTSRQWESSSVKFQSDPQHYLALLARSGRWKIDVDIEEQEKRGFDRFLDEYEFTAVLIGEQNLAVFQSRNPKAANEVLRLQAGDELPDFDARLYSVYATQAVFLVDDLTVTVDLYPSGLRASQGKR